MILYHYTSLKTLCAIVKGVKDNCMFLRANNAENMNDPNDCYYFINEFGKYLKVNNNDLSRLYQQKKAFNQPYIISLSQRKDDLHMWNCYGDNGNGIAIGMKYDSLLKMANEFDNKNHVSAKLYKCLYYSAPQIINTLELLNIVSEIDLSSTFWQDPKTIEISNIVKHPCYRYEKEYRIVILHGRNEFTINGVFNRDEDAFYFPMPLANIHSIVVGPNADFAAIKKIFSPYFSNAKFVQSTIPYRAK